MTQLATVTALPRRTAATKAPRAQSRILRNKLRRQAFSAAGIGAVAAVLTALSLDHLAQGVSLITGAHGWQPWAMASGVDLAYVGLEVAGLCATDRAANRIAKLRTWSLMATMGGSALLNALAFATNATTVPYQIGAAILGLAIPALVFVLTQIAATLYLDCSR